MMKTPEEINAINRETYEERAEKLRRLLGRHPSGWTAADARFYAEHLEAMEQTPEQARQMMRDAGEWLAFEKAYPGLIVSAIASLNGSVKAARPLTALIRSKVESDPDIDENRLWHWLKKQMGVKSHDLTEDSKTEWIDLGGDKLERTALRGRLHASKKRRNHANS